MSRLVAYMGSDPERLRAALSDYHDLLVVGLKPPQRAEAGDTLASTGIGFYQGGEVLLQRRPRISGRSIDLFEDLKDLRTDTFLAQVRDAIEGRLAKNENTPPFRFRSWSMTHQGSMPSFDRMREELQRRIPDFLRRNIRGQTATEHLFHLFLSALHETGSGNVEDANLPPSEVLKALLQAWKNFAVIAQTQGVTDGLTEVQVALTNGRCLCVLRKGQEPLWLRRLGAVMDGGKSYDHFRGYLIMSGLEASAKDRGFEELPVDHALLIGRDLSAQILPV